MTQGHPFPPRHQTARYHDVSDGEDEALSPSDGYFGSNNPIPDAVLILNPSHPQSDPSSNSSKAEEAAREYSSQGTNTPSELRYSSYTPATTYTPATSSRASESAYNGSTSRHRDSVDGFSERSPLLEEPPPLYEAIADWPPSNNVHGSNDPGPPPQSGHESLQVREPLSSPRTSAFGRGRAPQSMSVSVDNRTGKIYDEELEPALPRRTRRRGCCGRKQNPKKDRSRFKRCLSFLLGLILAIWLIVHLAKIVKYAHGRSPESNFPADGPFPPPPNSPGPTREFRQHETYRSIAGTFALYDLLELETFSGSISVTIVPHPGHLPATLRLASTSGSISVKIDNSYLNAAQNTQYQDALNRTFDTKITSFSGSVGGSILVGGGGQTTVSSRSGSLSLTIYPVNVDDGSPESKLSTSTTSGSSNLKIKPPIFGGKLTQLVAHHHSIGSGSMTIKYPSTWEGGIHAKSLGSGSVSVKGQGLQFEQHGSREMVAYRGGEKSRKIIDVDTLGSGSINFSC